MPRSGAGGGVSQRATGYAATDELHCCAAPDDRQLATSPAVEATALPAASVPRARKVSDGQAAWWSLSWKTYAQGERRPRQREMGNRHLFLFNEEAKSRIRIELRRPTKGAFGVSDALRRAFSFSRFFFSKNALWKS
jgi:hypothetical protein